MIGYFDTSALVPLLVAESSSEQCRRVWDDSDDVVSSRVTYVEAAAALAQATRFGRIAERQRRAAVRLLDGMWAEIDIVEVDEQLVRRVGDLAHEQSLRGYDAVHCASAESVLADDLVVVSGDRQLLKACSDLGIAAADVSSP